MFRTEKRKRRFISKIDNEDNPSAQLILLTGIEITEIITIIPIILNNHNSFNSFVIPRRRTDKNKTPIRNLSACRSINPKPEYPIIENGVLPNLSTKNKLDWYAFE